MTTDIVPLFDRVLVKRIAADIRSKGGLFLPDAKEKMQEGTVIAVGTGKVLEDGTVRPMSLKAGDHIFFGRYDGQEIKLDGEEHLIFSEADVLARRSN